MPQHVCNGALIKCSFAFPPPGTGSLMVLPMNKMMTTNQPAATIMDNKPMVNIMPFGQCMSPSQPSMASLGVPGPCVPATPIPWSPGAPTVMLGNIPVLNNTSTLTCVAMGGVITIMMPGQMTEMTP